MFVSCLRRILCLKFKKLTAIALVAVAAMGLLAGCGSEKSKMTQEAGVLRVGSETTFPPFEFTEGDKYVGFDVDLSEAIAKKLGLKWNSNPWASTL